ncbi:MAG TPA: sugar phosphate nucleotidyltransferase [Ktedonobacterales bacterium]
MTSQPPVLVVLAGGSNSRFWPLHEKSLFPFLGQPLLEHQLRAYAQAGFRRVVVVASPGNRERIEDVTQRLDALAEVRVVIQQEPRGMGDALLSLRPMLEERDASAAPMPVYVCQVHDVFDPSLHARMLKAHQSESAFTWLASYQVESYFPGGYLAVDRDLTITDIVEKPGRGHEPSNLISIVAHVHPDLERLLDQIEAEYQSPNPSDDHYERAMQQLMRRFPFKALPYTGPWHPVKYPWHVLDVMHAFLDQIQPSIAEDASIAPSATISGPVRVESGVRILDGASIVGPAAIGRNTLVGQNAHVRHSMVGEECIVGLGSEVNRSYLGRGAMLHTAKALDSVLAENAGAGQHINLSAGMITANLRSDGATIKSTVKGERIDTGRAKLGAMIGPGAFIGIGAMLMPGIKIGEGAIVGPATLVREDVADRTLHYAEQRYVTKPLDTSAATDEAGKSE